MSEVLEKILAAMLIELKPYIPDAEMAASLMRVAFKILPTDLLHSALTAEAKARADAAADAAEQAKFAAGG